MSDLEVPKEICPWQAIFLLKMLNDANNDRIHKSLMQYNPKYSHWSKSPCIIKGVNNGFADIGYVG